MVCNDVSASRRISGGFGFWVVVIAICRGYADLSIWVGTNWRMSANLFFVPMLLFSVIYLKPINAILSSKLLFFLGKSL